MPPTIRLRRSSRSRRGSTATCPTATATRRSRPRSLLDFVALDVYAPSDVRADDSPQGYAILPHLKSSPRMASPWLYVGPEVAYWAVRNVSELWKPKALYISENGCSADDPVTNGVVYDFGRIMYLRITAPNSAAQQSRGIRSGAVSCGA